MPVKISVRHNLEAVAKDLDDLAKKELPFAIALALTRTAQEVRDRLRANLGEHFTIRGPWVARSIQMDVADKRDADPVARVGSLYEPMALHAEGGEKRGVSGGSVGVPYAARPVETARTNISQQPHRLLAGGGAQFFFVARFQWRPFRVGAGSEVGVFERTGLRFGEQGPAARWSRGNRRNLKLWWVLEDEVQIKPDWPFEAEAVATVDAELFDNFWAAMEMARRTAR